MVNARAAPPQPDVCRRAKAALRRWRWQLPLRFAGALVAIIGCSAAAPERPGSPIVRAYDGSWRFHFTEVRSRFTAPSERIGTLLNDCSLKGTETVCVQKLNGALTATVHFQPTTHRGIFKTMTFYPGDNVPSSGELMIKGSSWSYPWIVHDGPTTARLKVVNRFIGDDRITYSKLFSVDGGHHWTRVGSGEEVRVGAP